MNIQWYLSPGETRRFANTCEAVIRNVGRATKTATEQACREILEASLAQVPRDTNTLASTGFYKVLRRSARSGYVYEGVVGYAGEALYGAEHDAINPRTSMPASSYAMIVHEDLSAYHPSGKAKFLEDPAREYGANNFSRVAETHWKMALETSSSGGVSYIPTESD